MKQGDIPSEVILSTEGGMPRDCVIDFDHIQTVQKGKLGALITILPQDKMQGVKQAVVFAFGLAFIVVVQALRCRGLKD